MARDEEPLSGTGEPEESNPEFQPPKNLWELYEFLTGGEFSARANSPTFSLYAEARAKGDYLETYINRMTFEKKGFMDQKELEQQPIPSELVRTLDELLFLLGLKKHDLFAGKTPAEVFEILWKGDYGNELIRVNPNSPKRIRKFAERYEDKIEQGKLVLPEGDPALARLDQLVDEINRELFGEKSIPRIRELLREALALIVPDSVEGYLQYFERRVQETLGS